MSEQSKVYLAGPINGCTDSEANDWRWDVRERVELRGWKAVDPMSRDYRGKEDGPGAHVHIVTDDLDDISRCRGLLVNAARPSWGTAMEVRAAWCLGLDIVAVVPPGVPVSPWLRYHTGDNVMATWGEAVARLAKLWDDAP